MNNQQSKQLMGITVSTKTGGLAQQKLQSPLSCGVVGMLVTLLIFKARPKLWILFQNTVCERLIRLIVLLGGRARLSKLVLVYIFSVLKLKLFWSRRLHELTSESRRLRFAVEPQRTLSPPSARIISNTDHLVEFAVDDQSNLAIAMR